MDLKLLKQQENYHTAEGEGQEIAKGGPIWAETSAVREF
jgi:hypothetical protein